MQLDLDFEGGVIDQYPDFGDCIRASVYSCGRQLKAIAADLDMSQSELSRKLNPQDSLNYDAELLPALIEATGNLLPVYWLIERFCQDSESKKKQSINELAKLLPKLQSLLNSVGAG